jgi:hypothetical protein
MPYLANMRIIIGRTALVGASAVALAGIVSSGSASAAVRVNHAKVFHAGHCTARGEYATCVAGGTANSPVTIRVHVRSSHKGQHVYVAWSDVCTKGDGAGSRSGSYNAKTVSNHKIGHPYERPDSCIVSADAQLNGGSFIKVWITYTR